VCVCVCTRAHELPYTKERTGNDIYIFLPSSRSSTKEFSNVPVAEVCGRTRTGGKVTIIFFFDEKNVINGPVAARRIRSVILRA